MWKLSEEQLVRYFDQTNLKPEVTKEDIAPFVKEAREYGFAAVAIMPVWIPLASELLEGSQTTIVAPIGYPMGTVSTGGKVQETEWAIKHGLKDIEIDMVMNVAMLKSRDYNLLEQDIREVVDAAQGRIVKVIIETPILTPDEIIIACMVSEKAGADFIKTSGGFKGFRGWRPSTVEDIRLIKSAVGDRLKVKVAGGVRTLAQTLVMIDAGVSRVGTSSGVQITESHRQSLTQS